MKKLLFLIPLLALCLKDSIAGDCYWNTNAISFPFICATNIWVGDYTGVHSNRWALWQPGVLWMNRDINNGPSFIMNNANVSGMFCLKNTGWQFSDQIGGNGPDMTIAADNTRIKGNLTVDGVISALTNLLYQTNLVWSTNAFYAPTNSQTTTLDMSIGYADIYIDGLTSPLTFEAGDLLADSYQTACVFIRNLHAQPSIVTIQAKNVPIIRGTPYVTNVSVLTFFTHNWTNDVWTNAIVLPLW